LETRAVPAAVVSLVSTADPAAVSDTAGGASHLSERVIGIPRQLSADGRFVAFTSVAANLIDGQGDGNNADDVFLFDRTVGQMTLVSRADGSPLVSGNAASFNP
jgi:hypothetical protein